MYRKDSIIIEEWLKSSGKALLVTGARQIGKTWLIREEIAKSGYRKFEVNFINQPDLVDYLNVKMSAEEFLVKLKMIMPEDCKPQETFERTIKKAINGGLVYVGISAGSMYAAGNLDDGLHIISNPIIPHWNGTKIIELSNCGDAIRLVDGQAVYVGDDCVSLI